MPLFHPRGKGVFVGNAVAYKVDPSLYGEMVVKGVLPNGMYKVEVEPETATHEAKFEHFHESELGKASDYFVAPQKLSASKALTKVENTVPNS